MGVWWAEVPWGREGARALGGFPGVGVVLTDISLMVPAPCQEATRGALISAGPSGCDVFSPGPFFTPSLREACHLPGRSANASWRRLFRIPSESGWQLRTPLSLGEAQKNGNAFPGS